MSGEKCEDIVSSVYIDSSQTNVGSFLWYMRFVDCVEPLKSVIFAKVSSPTREVESEDCLRPCSVLPSLMKLVVLAPHMFSFFILVTVETAVARLLAKVYHELGIFLTHTFLVVGRMIARARRRERV